MLMLINMSLSDALMKANLRLALCWRPRDENKSADDLSNFRTEGFKPELRVPFSFRDFDFSFTHQIMGGQI